MGRIHKIWIYWVLFLIIPSVGWSDTCPRDVADYLIRNKMSHLLSSCFLCGLEGGSLRLNKGTNSKKFAFLLSSHEDITDDRKVATQLKNNNWEVLLFNNADTFEKQFNREMEDLNSKPCKTQILFYVNGGRSGRGSTSYAYDVKAQSRVGVSPQDRTVYSHGIFYDCDGNIEAECQVFRFQTIFDALFKYRKNLNNRCPDTKIAIVQGGLANKVIPQVVNRYFPSEVACVSTVEELGYYSPFKSIPVQTWLSEKGYTTWLDINGLSDSLTSISKIGYGNPVKISEAQAENQLVPDFEGQSPGLDLWTLYHSVIGRRLYGSFDQILNVRNEYLDVSPLAVDLASQQADENAVYSFFEYLTNFIDPLLGTDFAVFGRAATTNNVPELWFRAWYQLSGFKQKWIDFVSNQTAFSRAKELVKNIEKQVENTLSRNQVVQDRACFDGVGQRCSANIYGSDHSTDMFYSYRLFPMKDLNQIVLKDIQNLDQEIQNFPQQPLFYNSSAQGRAERLLKWWIPVTYDFSGTSPGLRALIRALDIRWGQEEVATGLSQNNIVQYLSPLLTPADRALFTNPALLLQDSAISQAGFKYTFLRNGLDQSVSEFWHKIPGQTSLVEKKGDNFFISNACRRFVNMIRDVIRSKYPDTLNGFSKADLDFKLMNGPLDKELCEFVDVQERAHMDRVLFLKASGGYNCKEGSFRFRADTPAAPTPSAAVYGGIASITAIEKKICTADDSDGNFILSHGFHLGDTASTNPLQTEFLDKIGQRIMMARMLMFADDIIKARQSTDSKVRACADFPLK